MDTHVLEQGDHHWAIQQLRATSRPKMALMLMARTMFSHPRYGSLVLAIVVAFLLAMPATAARGQEVASANAAAAVDGDLLFGVGLVIGLPGTGDSAVDEEVVETSIVGVLRRAGLEPWRDQIGPGRIAVVMVSAELPEGSGDGAKVDVRVSAVGDARSIAGGTLLVAPLRDADGVVHATGQGAITMNMLSQATVQGVDGGIGLREAEIAKGAVVGRQKTRQGDLASLD
jgi:flagellar P-ring protein precursor FlgI